MIPYEDIAFAIVVWNDAERLEPLLKYVRPWFATIGVAVQESSDDSLAVAERLADIVVTDEHRGYGDASFGPLLLPRIRTKWTFKVDADEWPTERLLDGLGALTRKAEWTGKRGVWIPFRSWVDGFEWEEDHAHLRLFRTGLGWPSTLHSRPMIEDAIKGLTADGTGWIAHTRELDEMIQDYLRYYEVGRGNDNWDKHNRQMMRAACNGAAERRGWDYVTAFPWWPDVVAAAYEGEDPSGPKENTMAINQTVYAAGISSSGTRMLYDMLGKLGMRQQHASIPGYRFGEIPHANEHPVWWDREWMEERYGEGKWIIIRRDPWFAAQSAMARGFIKEPSEYAAYADRGNEVLKTVEDGAMEIQYEELVKAPQEYMAKMAAWLGVNTASAGKVFNGNETYPPKPKDWKKQLGWATAAKPRRTRKAKA